MRRAEPGARRRVFAREVVVGDPRRTDHFVARDTPGNVGVALSGGGSRACVAAMGQLRALRALGLLDRVRAISSVSGGAWLHGAWTFLPDDRDDEGFFGPLVADPAALVRRARGGAGPGEAIDVVAETCVAAPISSGVLKPGGLLAMHGRFEAEGARVDQRWAHVIGELLLGPLGLYHVDDRRRATAFFAADEAAAAAVRRANPGAATTRALTVRRTAAGPRPFALINTAIAARDRRGEAAVAPIQATPWFVGSVGASEAVDRRGQPIGGGGVEPFAYGGRLVDAAAGAPRIVAVEQEAVYGLHDLLGSSSAFYAHRAVSGRRSRSVVPEYERFPVGAAAPAGGPDSFLDGGAVENTGAASLLAWSDIERLLIFVNAPSPLKIADDGSGLPIVERQVPPLFGYRPHEEGVGYVPYDAVDGPRIGPAIASPRPNIGPAAADARRVADDFRRNAVFAAADFGGLLGGLLARASAGTGVPGVGPCALLQRGVRVVDNPWFGVRGGRRVDVLWVVLSPASTWVDRLDPRVARALPFSWPHYPTAATHLSKEAANLLAHFTAWVVLELQSELDALFRGA